MDSTTIISAVVALVLGSSALLYLSKKGIFKSNLKNIKTKENKNEKRVVDPLEELERGTNPGTQPIEVNTEVKQEITSASETVTELDKPAQIFIPGVEFVLEKIDAIDANAELKQYLNSRFDDITRRFDALLRIAEANKLSALSNDNGNGNGDGHKPERTPEQIQADRERMEKVRAGQKFRTGTQSQ